MVLKLGSTGEFVGILQEILSINPVDGIFGKQTQHVVQSFQKRNKLTVDGIVGPMTWKKLNFNPIEHSLDSDRKSYGNWIEDYFLPEGQYVNESTSKYYIVLHHTAGRENPYKTIDHWAQDNRGRVGTNYVIGGISVDGKNNEHDGKILRAIDDEFYGWHIGAGANMFIKKHSISIELCSAGGLTERDGKWYTWFGEEVDKSQIRLLKDKFRGYQAFHKYSDEQIKSLEALLRYLSQTHDIDLTKGMKNILSQGINPFELNLEASAGKIKGVLSHTNFRKDKSDIFPQSEIVELILRL